MDYKSNEYAVESLTKNLTESLKEYNALMYVFRWKNRLNLQSRLEDELRNATKNLDISFRLSHNGVDENCSNPNISLLVIYSNNKDNCLTNSYKIIPRDIRLLINSFRPEQIRFSKMAGKTDFVMRYGVYKKHRKR